jgi:hypothetical protein
VESLVQQNRFCEVPAASLLYLRFHFRIYYTGLYLILGVVSCTSVNQPFVETDAKRIRTSVKNEKPWGQGEWSKRFNPLFHPFILNLDLCLLYCLFDFVLII